jgi:hypothetical protein
LELDSGYIFLFPHANRLTASFSAPGRHTSRLERFRVRRHCGIIEANNDTDEKKSNAHDSPLFFSFFAFGFVRLRIVRDPRNNLQYPTSPCPTHSVILTLGK